MDLAVFSGGVNEGLYETTTLVDRTALQRRTRTHDESPLPRPPGEQTEKKKRKKNRVWYNETDIHLRPGQGALQGVSCT